MIDRLILSGRLLAVDSRNLNSIIDVESGPQEYVETGVAFFATPVELNVIGRVYQSQSFIG